MVLQNNLFVITIYFLLRISHPVHIAVSAIEINQDSNQYVISLKMFASDFQEVINKTYNINLDIYKDINVISGNPYIMDYVNKNFKIYFNKSKRPRKNSFINSYNDGESLWIIMKGYFPKKTNYIRIYNNILNDYFYDQTNLIIFSYNDYQEGFQTSSGNNIAVFNLKKITNEN
jgi:hypothetical protein